MKPRWFVRGDIDGFFGLFIDNLVQLVLMVTLCQAVCGFPKELVLGRVLPGAAISILLGNLFYAWQARKLMLETGRDDITALPYGINTPSLIAYVFLIMGPIYRATGNATLAWQAGLFACFLSGVMETAGAFVGDWIRRHTPRAALLSALAGIAITFISMGFVFQIFANPAIAILPTMVILIAYAARVRLPFGLPGGLVALIVGTALAWGLRAFGLPLFAPTGGEYEFGVYFPIPVIGDLLALLTDPLGWRYMAVILPMGLFNIIGSLQNLESAEAAGDRYETQPSLLVNGVGTMVAALFGSVFPTTIYIGHPGWKALGARAGYSLVNGVVVVALVLFGGIALVEQIVPLEAVIGILLWIGVIITAQAFQEIPKPHAIAVAVGLVPSLASWALLLIETTLSKAGATLYEVADSFGGELYIHGVIALDRGFLLTAMVLAAMMVYIVEREFRKAAVWALAAAGLSMVGLMHAYELTEGGIMSRFGIAAAPGFGITYALTAALLVALHGRAVAAREGEEPGSSAR
ncbi:permease [Candidatus Poribacteria bacterium]|nr:permease [Candidatus Poribacteria bacterium]